MKDKNTDFPSYEGNNNVTIHNKQSVDNNFLPKNAIQFSGVKTKSVAANQWTTFDCNLVPLKSTTYNVLVTLECSSTIPANTDIYFDIYLLDKTSAGKISAFESETIVWRHFAGSTPKYKETLLNFNWVLIKTHTYDVQLWSSLGGTFSAELSIKEE